MIEWEKIFVIQNKGVQMKKIFSIVGVIWMTVIMTACGAGNISPEISAVTQTSARPQIGVVFDSFVIERWQRDRDVFVATAGSLGADVNVQCANGDENEQKKIMEYFIQKKMDAIVVVAVNCAALKGEVEKAHKAGIRVIAYDRILIDSGVDLFVSFDNERVGQLMAQTINQKLPDGGKVIKINGPEEDNNVRVVNQGFDESLDSNIQVIGETNCSGWVGEEAFQYLNDHVEELDQADAIMCGNDSLAGQAVKALAERRRAGRVVVVGQDADLDACQRIADGTQTMTVYKPIEQLAKLAAQDTMYLISGQQIPNVQGMSDGTSSIPYVSIEPVRAEKDNLDSVIIDSGFHLREDVYRK